MKSLIVFIPFFGRTLPWLDLFLLSCRFNRNVTFVIISDFEIANRPRNVIHLKMDFQDYVALLRRKLDIQPAWTESYKLCDLKPALGYVFEDMTKGFDFWGYADIDLIFGDIESIYDDFVLSHDIISTHTYLMCGHFALFRNIEQTRRLFTSIHYWKHAFQTAPYVHFDEVHLTEFLLSDLKQMGFDRFQARFAPQLTFRKLIGNAECKVLFREQFTTFNRPLLLPNGVFAKPNKWTWKAGKIYCDIMPDREFLYAHFSAWNSGIWASSPNRRAPWKYKDVTISPLLNSETTAFSITEDGFAPD